MGNDGGSIPYRIDLVKTKAKEVKTDEKGLARALWLLCALSKKPLAQPVVSDPLGKVYNKDAIIEYLLDRTSYGDGDQICGYIKGVKDLLNLNVTPNPSLAGGSPKGPSTSTDTELSHKSPFICPLTMKEMIGTLPFGVIKSCGCVFSEGGIKAVINSTSGSSSPKDKNEQAGEQIKTLPCPNCSTPFEPVGGFGQGTGSVWWLPLNPKAEYQTEMLVQLKESRALKKEKSSKKRKSQVAPEESEEPTTKRTKASTVAGSAQQASNHKVQAELMALEAKRKAAGMSAAVKSIYAGKTGQGTGLKASGNDFFSRTFNRYA